MNSIVYIAFTVALGILLIQAVWDNHQNPPGGYA